MRNSLLSLLALTVCLAAAPAQDVLISEIMYNPNSSEASPNDVEWVEIYNPGVVTVDIGGWWLEDEDGATGMIPAGMQIAPCEAIVLISDTLSPAAFEAAWGNGYKIIALSGFGSPGLSGLANSPSATNEILSLRNGGGIVDEVNFDDGNGWPSDSPDGSSIYLSEDFMDATLNDMGSSWLLSQNGVHGAIQNAVTPEFNGNDFGSPGFVTNSACVVQPDLGFGFPGNMRLRVSGAPLTSLGTATLRVTNALPSNTVFLAFGPVFNPIPIAASTFIVDIGTATIGTLTADINGVVDVPGLPGGGGPGSLFLQAVEINPAFPPDNLVFSNGVEMQFLP